MDFGTLGKKKIVGVAGLVSIGVCTFLWLRTPSQPPVPSASPSDSPKSESEYHSRPDQPGDQPDLTGKFLPGFHVSPSTQSVPADKATASSSSTIPNSTNPSGLSKSSTSALPAQKIAPNSIANSLPAALPEGCFRLAFKHQKLASHADGEACLRHRNLLTLEAPKNSISQKINPGSVCVEVNGEVVKHQTVPGHANQILIDATAGPNATITARFCTGKSSCQQACIFKPDRFMSALGMAEEETAKDGVHTVSWDGSQGGSQTETELETEVKTFQEAGDSLFTGWLVQEMTSLTCQKGGSHDSQAIRISQRANP